MCCSPDLKNNFDKRINGVLILFSEIIPGFKPQFVDAGIFRGFREKCADSAVVVCNAFSDFVPAFFIFRQTELAAKGIDWSADAGVRISTLIRHLDYMIEDSGEAKAVREMRKHAMGYLKGLEGASKAKAAINSAMTRDDYLRALEAVESAASAVR